MAMLQRLYDPTEGQVLVDGVDLREIDSAWFRSQIGVVDQDPRLFAETIRSNIAYSMEDTPEVKLLIEHDQAVPGVQACIEFCCILRLNYHTCDASGLI